MKTGNIGVISRKSIGDSPYIYVGGSHLYSSFYKYNTSNLLINCSTNITTGGVYDIAETPKYIYIATGTSINKVLILNKSDLSFTGISSVTFEDPLQSIDVNRNNVFVGGLWTPVTILKISDLSYVNDIDLGTPYTVWSLITSGNYIYFSAVFDENTKRIYKVNIESKNIDGIINTGGIAYNLLQEGYYIYTGFDGVAVKINKDTFTIDEQSKCLHGDPRHITMDSKYVYYINSSSPWTIAKVDKTDMSLVGESSLQFPVPNNLIANNGNYLYLFVKEDNMFALIKMLKSDLNTIVAQGEFDFDNPLLYLKVLY